MNCAGLKHTKFVGGLCFSEDQKNDSIWVVECEEIKHFNKVYR